MKQCDAKGCTQAGQWRLLAATGPWPLPTTSLVLCTEHRDRAQATFAHFSDLWPATITADVVLAAAEHE